MATVRIKVERLEQVQRALTDYPRKAKEETRAWARGIAYEQRDLIRANIHSRTGHTARYGVQVFEQTQGEKGYFEIRLSQVVQWLDRGTGIFGPFGSLIRPLHSKVLRFVSAGRVFYRAWVRGMEAQHVVGAGVNEMASRLPARLATLRARLGALWGQG